MVTKPVGTWVDPAFGSQTGTVLKTNYDNAHAVAKRGADAFAPHESSPAAMTVEVDAGAIWDGVTLTEVAAQTTGLIVAPVTLPRIDRLVRDRATGTISVVTGVEDAAPVLPAITAGAVPVAQIGQLETTTLAITNALIADERPPERESVIQSRGAIVVGNASGDPVALAVGAVGQVPTSDGTDTAFADVPLPRSYLTGFGLAPNVTDPGRDIDVAVGACRSGADDENMVLASALIKRIDEAWQVGTNLGGWSSNDITGAQTVTFTDNGASPDFVTIDAGTWTVTPAIGNMMIVTGGLNAGYYQIQLAPTSTRIDVITGLFVNEAASTAQIRIIPDDAWVYVFAIKRTDTGVVDVMMSVSPTAPVLPTGYDKFRRIGCLFVIGIPPGGDFVKFLMRGDRVTWDSWQDGGASFWSTAGSIKTVRIPPIPGITWLGQVRMESTGLNHGIITSPLSANLTPGSSRHHVRTAVGATEQQSRVEIETDDGTVRERGSTDDGNFMTIGYLDRRGRDGGV